MKILLVASAFIIASSLHAQKLKSLESAADVDAMFKKTKGKVTLINLWATWCKPCVHEFPDLVKLYKEYKDDDFRLVFISLDDKGDVESQLIPFLKKQGVNFTSYHNAFSKPEDLIDLIDKSWQGAIPTTYIYDKEGKMTQSFLGTRSYEEFEKEITKLLD
jgi:thiol-disulfide isomerase/thioredoxin